MRPKTRAIVLGAALATGAAVAGIDWSQYIQQQNAVPPVINTKQTTLPGSTPLPVSCASGNVSSCMATVNQNLLVSACKEVNATPVTAPTASTKSASECTSVSKLSVSSYYANVFLPGPLGEGYVSHYYDVAGGCTVGVGHLVYYPQRLCPVYTPPKNKKVKSIAPPVYLGKIVSPGYIESLKKQDVYAAEQCVRMHLSSVDLSQCEFNSLVDVAFNAGCGGAQPIFTQVLASQKMGSYKNTANAIKNRGFGVPNRERREAKIFYTSAPGVCNHNNASDLCE